VLKVKGFSNHGVLVLHSQTLCPIAKLGKGPTHSVYLHIQHIVPMNVIVIILKSIRTHVK